MLYSLLTSFIVYITTLELCIVEGKIDQWQIKWTGWGRKPFWGGLWYFTSIYL